MTDTKISPAVATLSEAPYDPRFREELHTALWLQQEVRAGRKLPVLEADAVVHALYAALQQDGSSSLPQLALHDMTEYLAVHAINVSLLAMALAEVVDFDASDVRAVGLAALLHDIGMTRIPVDLLATAGPLSTPDRALMMQHPADGAKIIVDADVALDLAAIVAYEHHIGYDGSGYPARTYTRTTHYVSRLVQLCDIYHALSTPRPFRAAWPRELAIAFVREHGGFEYDPGLATAFVRVLEQRTAPSTQAVNP